MSLLHAASVSPAPEATPGDTVKITATIYRVNADGKEEILAEPAVIAPLGHWARVRHGRTMQVPTGYSLPSIPAEAARGMDQKTPEGEKLFTTNDRGLVIPPHPEKLETVELGISARFRPRLLSNGDLVVDSEIENRESAGWVDEGTELFFEKAGPGGKKRKHLITANRQKLHKTSEELAKYHYVRKPGEDTGITLPVAEGDDQTVSQNLKLRMEAEWLPEPTGEGDPVEAGDSFYITTKFIELSHEDGAAEDLFPEKPILTDAELQLWIRELSQRRGVDLLSAPSMVVAPGQEGRVELMREFIYPASYVPPEIPDTVASSEAPVSRSFEVTPANPDEFATKDTGVAMSITARRARKEGFVELTLEPEVIEFKEFSNFGEAIRSWHPPGFGSPPSVVISENRMEMPIFETVSMQTIATIPNGSSIVLGRVTREDIQTVEDKVPLLGDLPWIGRLTRTQTEVKIKKRLLFVISVKAVDEKGR